MPSLSRQSGSASQSLWRSRILSSKLSPGSIDQGTKSPPHSWVGWAQRGPCPLCGELHYYFNKKSGKRLISTIAGVCKRFKELTVEDLHRLQLLRQMLVTWSCFPLYRENWNVPFWRECWEWHPIQRLCPRQKFRNKGICPAKNSKTHWNFSPITSNWKDVYQLSNVLSYGIFIKPM